MASFEQSAFVPEMEDREKEKTTRLAGLELEVMRPYALDEEYDEEDDDEGPLLLTKADNIPGIAKRGFDGGDVEFACHPMSISLIRKGKSHLNDVFDFLRENGFGTSERSGTHININKLPSDSKYTYENILWLNIVFQPQIQRIFGRRSHWAPSPAEKLAKEIPKRNMCKADPKAYKFLIDVFFKDTEAPRAFSFLYNKQLMVTDKDNRYEFRGGKSTVDQKEAEAWIEFCINIVEIAASNKNVATVRFRDFLKGDLIKPYFDKVVQKNLNRELTREELNQIAGRVQKLAITDETDAIY